MPTRNANATWKGGLKEGRGEMEMGSGTWSGAYSFGSRFQDAGGTNPEELIGAALAGCFSMALSAALERAGHSPEEVSTKAKVHLEKEGDGFAVQTIELDTEARVPGLDDETFQEHAAGAKKNCPVSKALAGVDVQLDARLIG